MRTALCLLFGLAPVSVLALDLNPIPAVKVLEGVNIPQLQFKDGNRRVTWRPPADWRMTYEEGKLMFIPRDLSAASLELRVIPRKSNDQEVLARPDTLARYAADFLPKTATEIAAGGTNQGTFTLNAIPSREFLFDYSEAAHPSQASFNIVDLNDRERLIVVITAQRKDFQEVRAAAIQCLFSWSEE